MRGLCLLLIPVTVFAQNVRDERGTVILSDPPLREPYVMWLDIPAPKKYLGEVVQQYMDTRKQTLAPPPVNFEKKTIAVDDRYLAAEKIEDENGTRLNLRNGLWLGPLFIGGLYSWVGLWAWIVQSWHPFVDVTVALLVIGLGISVWNTVRKN